ncbi:MAG: NADPH-dependent assimilatory sulfite reductase hemoprotein subunit, partial [Thermoguttaceae bacterium]
MAESHSLPGRIPEEPPPPVDPASDEAAELAADDRVYVQDDRDRRRYLGAPSGRSDTVASLMVRIGVPGGRLSGDQLLATLDVCDELGGGTLRATSRQALQIHFVPKRNIREVLRRIDGAGLTTRATNGDVRRNVMCCPAPYRREPVHDQMQWLALRLSEELAPRPGNGPSDGAAGAAGSADGGGTAAQVDPLYGKARLPHRFNVGIGLPGDNCVDLYAQDAGLLAICENFNVVGYNVLVGGGMGMTPGDENTFPALARPMAFTRPDQAIEVVKAVYAVHRDFGDRADRSRGRLKYLVAQWGVPKFKAQVEGYLGWTLPEPRPEGVWDVDDHVGWHEQGDGRWFYGLHLVNGRILDADGLRLKSALREICRKYRPAIALTPGHGILLCDVRWEDRPGVEDLLRRHGVKSDHEISSARRWSMACVALPTCSLAV